MIHPRYQPTIQRAFTLVELLVVIAIILVLAGLLIPTLNMLRARQLRTQAIQDLGQYSVAIEQYLVAFETLPMGGVDSFDRKPYQYLYHVPIDSELTPYTDLPASGRMGHWLDESTWTISEDAQQGQFLLDPWGQPYRFDITMTSGRGGLGVVESVLVYTDAGSSPQQALGKRLDFTRSMEWVHLSGAEALPDNYEP